MVPRLSNTAIGTAFELATLSYLTKLPLSLSLIRVGGRNDRGVDLRGWWAIPPSKLIPDSNQESINLVASSSKLRLEGEEIKRKKRWSVIVQCKAESKTVGPGVVRELEGTIGYEDLEKGTISREGSVEEGEGKGKRRNKPQTVGFLISQGGFSKEALLRAAASTFPLSLIELDFRSSSNSSSIPIPSAEIISSRGEKNNNKPIRSIITFNPALKRLLGMEDIVPGLRSRSFSVERKENFNIERLNVPERNGGRNPISVC